MPAAAGSAQERGRIDPDRDDGGQALWSSTSRTLPARTARFTVPHLTPSDTDSRDVVTDRPARLILDQISARAD